MANPEVKVLIFSEWERMLELVGSLCRKLRVEFASHTGSITPAQRRQEVQRFREEPDCRVLLSTDTGGLGLNLQNASVVVNCDQPWNPRAPGAAASPAPGARTRRVPSPCSTS